MALGSEVSDGVISPIVPQALGHKVTVINEGMYWQQLHRSHSQAGQIVDYRGGGQASVGAAQCRRHFRMLNCEPFDVNFVNNTLVPGNTRRPISSPCERGIDHYALQHSGSTVATIEREILVAVTDTITEV